MFIAKFFLWEDFAFDDFAFASEETAEPLHEKYKSVYTVHRVFSINSFAIFES